MVQTVLGGAQGAADVGHVVDGVLDGVQRSGGTFLIGNINSINADSCSMAVVNGNTQLVPAIAGVSNLQGQPAGSLGAISCLGNVDARLSIRIDRGVHAVILELLHDLGNCVRIQRSAALVDIQRFSAAFRCLAAGKNLVLLAINLQEVFFGNIGNAGACNRKDIVLTRSHRANCRSGCCGTIIFLNSGNDLGLVRLIPIGICDGNFSASAIRFHRIVISENLLQLGSQSCTHVLRSGIRTEGGTYCGLFQISLFVQILQRQGNILVCCAGLHCDVLLKGSAISSGNISGCTCNACFNSFYASLSRHRTIQQLDAVEVGGVSNAVDLVLELGDLLLELGTVGLILIGAVGGLLGQLVHAVEHVVDLGEGALGGLHQGDTVLGVVLGLVQAGDLGAHLLGDGQTRGVVAGPVDLIAGRQLLQVLGQGAGVVGVVAVGVHRHDVVLNTHDLYSSLMFCGQVPSCPALISQPPQAFTAAKRSC